MSDGKPVKAYAATFYNGEGINPYSVRVYAREVREWIGSAFAIRDEPPSAGWARARKVGVRIIRVRISQEPSP